MTLYLISNLASIHFLLLPEFTCNVDNEEVNKIVKLSYLMSCYFPVTCSCTSFYNWMSALDSMENVFIFDIHRKKMTQEVDILFWKKQLILYYVNPLRIQVSYLFRQI